MVRILGVIFILIGLLIVTGIDKRVEAAILERYDISGIETNIIDYIFPKSTDTMNTTTSQY